jgi:L-ascorbate metabolism protein UlaG (beta-lactamase superfamily)
MACEVTWLGHGSFALDVGDHKLVVDPFLSGNPAASTTPESVEADYILVSHGHNDHTKDVMTIARQTGAMVIANHEIAGWFEKQGISNVHAQHIGGGYHYPFGYLKFTIAHHGSGLPDGSVGGNPAGFLLTTPDGKKIYFACDTGLFLSMQLYGDEGIDLAFLPIGDNFTMGPDDALRAVRLLRPKVVIPVHFNTWDLIKQDGQAWVDRVNRETDAEGVLLSPGESYTL